MNKDPSNLPVGTPTFGFWEFLSYTDTALYDWWMLCAEPHGLGLGLGWGLIVSTLTMRALFVPSLMYSQITGFKMMLLKPDVDEMTASVKRYSS
jgi:membrane protein insertase Oxa1/YidC/SpoIIIJ